jgi:hypothetical protein
MANNRIQIKRSTANATVTGLANGELAFTQASNTLHIGLPDGSGVLRIGGAQYPGTLTNNHSLVANTTGGIDKVITANLVPQQVYANGSFGTSNYVLVSGGSSGNVRWESASAVGGVNTDAQYAFSNTITFNGAVNANNIYSTATVNATTLSIGAWVVANNSGVFTSGVVNGDIIRVGTNIVSNTTQFTLSSNIKFAANGAVGSANQVLRTDSSGVAYWSDDAGDISGITAGDGLTGGGSSGDITVDVGAGNGIEVNATAVAVKAGDGIASNSTGVHVVAGNTGVISNTSGVFVNAATFSIATSQLSGDVALGTQTSGDYVSTITAGNGISGSASGEGSTPTIAVVANDGIVSNSSGVFVKAGTGVTVNATGVHIGQAVGTTDNVTFANVVTTGLTVNGNTALGDSTSDKVTVNARVDSALVPTTNNAYDLGSNTLRWANVYINHISTTDGATFGSNVSIDGTLTVSGNLVTQNVQSIIVSDPLIYLAGNNYSSDLVDIGLAANYNDGVTNRHTGLFRDHTDGIWKLFTNLTQELSGNNDINTGDASYRTATLVAYLASGALSTNTTAVDITANSTVAVSIVANTLSLSTALPGTSGGTGLASYTAEDILVANSSNGFRKLGIGTSGYVLQSNGSALVYDVLDGGTF